MAEYRYPDRTTVNVARSIVERADGLRPARLTKQEWYDHLLERGMQGLRKPAAKPAAKAKKMAATKSSRQRGENERG